MKVKEFIELCMDKYCGFIIYDEATNKRIFFTHAEEAISKYGFFGVKGWEIERQYGISASMLIKIRSQF